MGRKPLSQEQRETTRQKLFETSNRMIAEGGIDNLNIRSLCKEVGISYSSFYDYYKNKDELIASKSNAMDQFFVDNEAERLHNEDFYLDLKNFILLYSEFVSSRNIEIIREVYRMQMYSILKRSPKEERPIRSILKRIIQEGIDRKQLPENINIEDMERMILSFCKGIAIDWCACDGGYSIEDFTNSAVNTLDLLRNKK